VPGNGAAGGVGAAEYGGVAPGNGAAVPGNGAAVPGNGAVERAGMGRDGGVVSGNGPAAPGHGAGGGVGAERAFGVVPGDGAAPAPGSARRGGGWDGGVEPGDGAGPGHGAARGRDPAEGDGPRPDNGAARGRARAGGDGAGAGDGAVRGPSPAWGDGATPGNGVAWGDDVAPGNGVAWGDDAAPPHRSFRRAGMAWGFGSSSEGVGQDAGEVPGNGSERGGGVAAGAGGPRGRAGARPGAVAASGDRDPLTGFPGRSGLRSALADATRRGGGAAVVAVRVEDLRRINREQGESRGDETLRAVASLLADAAGPSGTTGRLSGATLAAIVPSLTADALLHRLRAGTRLDLVFRTAVADIDASRPEAAFAAVEDLLHR
jgi:GGDEF domain-containing protein